jgi:hypothetical protein
MSFEERNAVVCVLVSLISWGMMITVLGQNTLLGRYDGVDGMMLWARAVLWLIVISISIGIVLTILFNIGYVIITGEAKPSFKTDERDGLITLRAMQVAQGVLAIGIVFAIIFLAWGGAGLMFLNLIMASCGAASLGGDVTKLYLYRRGF